MEAYEYKVMPAPMRGDKERGLKTGADRFAHALGALMNELARDGWEYWRAETLPAEERSGLTSKATVYHNLLVFRRALTGGGGTPIHLLRADTAAGAAAAVEAEHRPVFTALAPEGRAPRLGPAGEDET
jgi:hypothetical protein